MSMNNRIRVRFSPLFPATLALLCMSNDGRMVAWCLLAAAMHEGGHLAVMLWRHVHPQEIRFSAFGLCIVCRQLLISRRDQELIALGGPAVNLLTAAILAMSGCDGTWMVIHLSLGMFNLLPIWPLDGGQCLSALCRRHLGFPAAKQISRGVSTAFLFLLTAAAVGMLREGNVSLLLVTVYLWVQNLRKNKD